ncbi:PREDICTED: uncharacterized protein LOC18594332 isoform X1 [Theobroma cacao]|uniref:Uncharacterized protein LOC18594332 isoform X1 n=2 Tax=Theobroma cacao TaxID=3641 RepID=A0AB32WRH0_THECC|nr:PREDICTED: uncharacterized protein LOC18594332 isoform X1 [Theobroma cacao]EOY13437.1 NHL domain-containing protein isoform 2 [Theobroma cacao]
MRESHLFFTLILLLVPYTLHFQAHAAPAGPLIKHFSSLLKWTRSSTKTPQSDGNVLQFENGYLVETVVEGNEIGVVPYKIRVSEDGELFAVDEVNSNIVKITPPLSQYSRGRLVAGSFQGYTGHVDGKPSEARFNHPKGVTMDDKGNVYVADTMNLAIRKIGDAGVTTIAGGKSNVAGYRDGPSEDAQFSNDFDVVYVQPTCSLLVIDRGNAALRQISLNQDDCDYQYSSVSPTDILMVVGAVLVGYATCLLQQGFGSSFFPRMQQPTESEFKEQPSKQKPTPIVESVKEEPGWPSFGQLVMDLSKLALEAMATMFLYFVPSRFRSRGSKKGLTPMKDSLRMPEDEAPPPLVQRQTTPAPVSETRQTHTTNTSDKHSEMKPSKIIKSSSFKDPSLSSKHRSSKRQEFAEFYGSAEVPPYSRSKIQKERTRHRQRDKIGEVVFGTAGTDQKPVETKPVVYDNSKFDHYNMRSKYGSSDSFRF